MIIDPELSKYSTPGYGIPGRRSTAAWAGVCLALHLGGGALFAARLQLDLTGAWDFYPDVGGAALASAVVKPGRIIVPGAWQAQGYGQPGGTIPASLLNANTSPADHLRHNLTARCLYVRSVEVPVSWKGRRVFLAVRRVYTCADVSVNGKRIGEWEGFCSPFEFDVTDAILFGARNQFVIGVDNRSVLDCGSPLPLSYSQNQGLKSGRGLPQSKTCGLGVGSWRADQ